MVPERALPTNVFGSGCHWPLELTHKLLGIKTDLNNIVEQSEERSERKRRHKQRHETKLYDCREART